jgi:hypothetical protein
MNGTFRTPRERSAVYNANPKLTNKLIKPIEAIPMMLHKRTFRGNSNESATSAKPKLAAAKVICRMSRESQL